MMEMYRVTYQQLGAPWRELQRKKDDDSFLPIPGPEDYEELTRLVGVPVPDMGLIESFLRSCVTLEKDQSHWFYITNIEQLGFAIIWENKDES